MLTNNLLEILKFILTRYIGVFLSEFDIRIVALSQKSQEVSSSHFSNICDLGVNNSLIVG